MLRRLRLMFIAALACALPVAASGADGSGSYLLEFAMPLRESAHDVIELKPRR